MLKWKKPLGGYFVSVNTMRGCAKETVRLAKEAGLESLQLSVERDNEPSIKTILKNGGKYERSFEFEG